MAPKKRPDPTNADLDPPAHSEGQYDYHRAATEQLRELEKMAAKKWDPEEHRRWRTLEIIRNLWEQYPDLSLTELLWRNGVLWRNHEDMATVLLDDDAVGALLEAAYRRTPHAQKIEAALDELLQMSQEMGAYD